MYRYFLGIKYKFNGNSIQEGYDCITLVSAVAKAHNIYIPNVNHQNHTINTFAPIFKDEIASGRWIEVEKQPLVAVVFRIAGKIQHIGFMIDDERFIHILQDSNVTIEKLSNPNWNKRVVGFYTYKAEK